MNLKKLELTHFRSHTSLLLDFEPGTNLFVGRNGAGKTNIVEAIGYLATLRSHRVASDQFLIQRGAQQAYIRGLVHHQDRDVLLELELNNGKSNRARVNQVPQARERDALGYLKRVIFAPEDLEIIKGDPSARRDFIDDLLITISPRISSVISDYERALKQRNSLLKSAQGKKFDESTLEIWDEKIAELGAELILERLGLISKLRNPFIQEYQVLSGASEAGISYKSSLEEELPEQRDELTTLILAKFKSERKKEVERGLTLVGPHRDELLIQLGQDVAKGYASHGESWSLALALKLASMELLQEDEPVLILDDVFAELDGKRRDALTNHLQIHTPTQLFITAAVVEDVPHDFRTKPIFVESHE
jgi:DNA replication and repair protein RecF